jgi:hypothetical protein
MLYKEINYFGTTRITNPNTLQRWIDNGKYNELIKENYLFGIGCGRFVLNGCVCTACRNRPKKEFIEVLKRNKLI